MSDMKKCASGHFYDADKFTECPHCRNMKKRGKDVFAKGQISDDYDDMVTVAKHSFGGGSSQRRFSRPNVTGNIVKPPEGALERDVIAAKNASRQVFDSENSRWQNMEARQSVQNSAFPSEEEDDQKTIGIFSPKSGNIDPVTGWIVALNGEERGKDFRLHAGYNTVGRSFSMDVSLMKDAQITRDKHCQIAYDDRGNQFFLVPGNGTLTYLNGKRVAGAVEIQDNDEIEIGSTRFRFISFCRGDYVWKKDETDEN